MRRLQHSVVAVPFLLALFGIVKAAGRQREEEDHGSLFLPCTSNKTRLYADAAAIEGDLNEPWQQDHRRALLQAAEAGTGTCPEPPSRMPHCRTSVPQQCPA